MTVLDKHVRFTRRLLAGTAFACTAVLAGWPVAPAEAVDPAIEDLQRQLKNRDEVINDLLRRVGELEQRAAASATRQGADAGTPSGSVVPAAMRPLPEPKARGRLPLPAQQPGEAGAPPPSEAPKAKPAKPAPGAIEVDEEAAERALERTLVAGGALLLPFGQAEFEPSFTYTRREGNVPQLVDVGGDLVGGNQDIKRDEMLTTLGLRVGLPWDTQLELGLPYNVVYQQTTLDLGAGVRASESDTGTSIGDVSIGLAKTLSREKGWWPDIVGRVTYDSNTGEKVDNGVVMGTGFHDLRGSLTMVKRQDPLAFVGTAAYEHTFEDDNIEPGDQYTLAIGTILAVSPQTSLRFFLQQQYIDSVERDGDNVDNSDQRVATAQIGLSTVLGRGVLFDIVGGIGLTNDSPDYFVGFSLPVRFNVPVPQGVMP